jgi:hypothetical protein
MPFTFSLLIIVTGLAIMTFGLFLFYAWLPLLYAVIGFDIGLLLGRTLMGDVGATAIVLGIVGAVILGAASYLLEPYRRILLGISGGALFGLSVASAFGLDGLLGGFFGRMLAVACALTGSFLVPRFFDLFVICASAVSGAALVMIGAHHILPGVGVFDSAGGGVLPVLLTMILAVVGVSWQCSNIAKWNQMLPASRDGSDASTKDRNSPLER